MPITGLENMVSISIKAGLSFRGSTAPLILPIPTISTAKPSMMSPTLSYFFLNMRMKMPTSAMMPVKVAVEKRDNQPPPPPPTAESAITQPVMLVPRMAPSTIGIALRNFIMPELTKPTAMTEVADDD